MLKPDDFTRVDNDINGNPRYVCHFLKFSLPDDVSEPWDISGKYEKALFRARSYGGKRYRAKHYGGGVVFQSYNLQDLCDKVNKHMGDI